MQCLAGIAYAFLNSDGGNSGNKKRTTEKKKSTVGRGTAGAASRLPEATGGSNSDDEVEVEDASRFRGRRY